MKPEDKYFRTEDDATQYDAEQEQQEETTEEQSAVTANKTSDGVWSKVAVAGAVGLSIGAIATYAAKKSDTEAPVEDEHPAWVDDAVPVAENVSDDMSFKQAFNVARAEVGSGGVFEWRGNIYSTFTEGEWDAMTAEDKAEYGSHFDWHGDTTYTAQQTQHSQPAAQQQPVEQHVTEQHTAEHHVAQSEPATQTMEPVVAQEEPVAEVEVLGVVHDEELDVTVGGVLIDDQEVALIDVDNDNTFDVLVADVDGNGEIDDNEIVDISDQNITVDQLGGMTGTQESSFYTTSDEQTYDSGIQGYGA